MKRLAITLLSIILANVSTWAIDFSKLDTLRTVYYVKANGTGYGSGWDDALGNAEFNYVLARARRGATFYLAAGKYVPVLDASLEKTDDVTSRYTIKKSVTIIGGYPASPTENDISNPSKYITRISGDVKGDDIAGDFSSNRTDDRTRCMVIAGKNPKRNHQTVWTKIRRNEIRILRNQCTVLCQRL